MLVCCDVIDLRPTFSRPRLAHSTHPPSLMARPGLPKSESLAAQASSSPRTPCELSSTRTRGTHASFGMRISHVRGPSAMSVGSWPSTSDAEVPHAIFTVKVHAQMLKAPEALPVASNRHSVRVARAVHAYNLFIKIEVKRLRTLDAR